MNRKLYSLLVLCLFGAFGASAQELNCKVKVLHEKITGVDKEVFTSMERNITDFLNSRKWTTDDVQPNERIDCNILINLTAALGGGEADAYTATVNISATRPVYNSGYTSTTLNYVDRDVEFRYNQYTNLQFDDNRVSGTDALAANLTAVLAYYAYMVIGLDYDSFSKNGGTPYFKKAQNIVNNAPDQSAITGWKAFEDKRNRYWIMDQLLSPRYQSLRDYWYTFHREGLDIMYNKPADGRAKVLGGIAGIGQLQKDNPGATLIQFFFNAKSDELIRIIAQEPKAARAPYVTTLAQVDVSNAARYNALK